MTEIIYLSDHFSLREAWKDHKAIRLGIDNFPSESIIPNLEFIAENILEPIRDEYGKPFTPNSWYRCHKFNKAIGGSRTSVHKFGLGVDIELIGWDNADFAHWCAEYLDYDQLILEYYQQGDPKSGWVHIGLKPDEKKYRGQYLTAQRGVDGKTVYRNVV